MINVERESVILAGNKVTLRAFSIEDARAVVEALQDPEIHRWTTAIPFPYTEQHFIEWLGQHDSWWRLNNAVHFAVVGNSSGEVTGAIGLDFIDWEEKSGRCGYWMAAGARGKGYATSALDLVKTWSFEVFGLEALHLLTMIGNLASERVAAKAGFTLVGLASTEEVADLPLDRGLLNHWKAVRQFALRPGLT